MDMDTLADQVATLRRGQRMRDGLVLVLAAGLFWVGAGQHGERLEELTVGTLYAERVVATEGVALVDAENKRVVGTFEVAGGDGTLSLYGASARVLVESRPSPMAPPAGSIVVLGAQGSTCAGVWTYGGQHPYASASLCAIASKDGAGRGVLGGFDGLHVHAGPVAELVPMVGIPCGDGSQILDGPRVQRGAE